MGGERAGAGLHNSLAEKNFLHCTAAALSSAAKKDAQIHMTEAFVVWPLSEAHHASPTTYSEALFSTLSPHGEYSLQGKGIPVKVWSD